MPPTRHLHIVLLALRLVFSTTAAPSLRIAQDSSASAAVVTNAGPSQPELEQRDIFGGAFDPPAEENSDIKRATKCRSDEIFRGRYCDRRGGSTSMWYEQCWSPGEDSKVPLDKEVDPLWDIMPDEKAPAKDNPTWQEYIDREMAIAGAQCDMLGTKECQGVYPPKVPEGGTLNYWGHVCPHNYMCVQLHTKQFLPYILCQKRSIYKRNVGGSWIEPHTDDWSMYAKVAVREMEKLPYGTQAVTAARSFVMPATMDDAAISIMVFDAQNFQLVPAQVKVTKTTFDRTSVYQCAGWRYYLGPSCLLNSLEKIRKGERWNVEFMLKDDRNLRHGADVIVSLVAVHGQRLAMTLLGRDPSGYPLGLITAKLWQNFELVRPLMRLAFAHWNIHDEL